MILGLFKGTVSYFLKNWVLALLCAVGKNVKETSTTSW